MNDEFINIGWHVIKIINDHILLVVTVFCTFNYICTLYLIMYCAIVYYFP
jgi:hypothetical protein